MKRFRKKQPLAKTFEPLRHFFALTEQEKFWLFVILAIFWVGLVARYVHLKNQKSEMLSPQEVEILMMKDE